MTLERPEELRRYDEIWGSLQARALSPENSRVQPGSSSAAYRDMQLSCSHEVAQSPVIALQFRGEEGIGNLRGSRCTLTQWSVVNSSIAH